MTTVASFPNSQVDFLAADGYAMRPKDCYHVTVCGHSAGTFGSQCVAENSARYASAIVEAIGYRELLTACEAYIHALRVDNSPGKQTAAVRLIDAAIAKARSGR